MESTKLNQERNINNMKTYYKRQPRIKIKCAICGNIFLGVKSRKYCKSPCSSKFMFKPRGKEWALIVEYINERDNYKCQECGSDNRISVHHKIPLFKGGSNKEDNLVTLCPKCHSKAHMELAKKIFNI